MQSITSSYMRKYNPTISFSLTGNIAPGVKNGLSNKGNMTIRKQDQGE
jgi:hypothetical protein